MTTDVEGFIEAVMPDVSGTDAAKKEEAIAEAMVKLYTDPGIRETLEIECKRSAAEKSVVEEVSEIQQGSILIAVTIKEKQDFVVGTVKGLSDKYGIRYILEAVAAVKNDNQIPIRLRIAGKGPQEQEYRRLAEDLGISDITTWLGFISQEQAAVEWANMDTAIIPSTLESESFGVSAVEAQACGTPVIISDIPGLMEATKPGKSSIVVKRCESEEIADAIRRIYADSILQKNMQRFGLEYVHGNYELNKCFQHIEKLLKNCLQ
jgi:glycosyltransferase involved in cell wall biosynthesis